MGRKKKAENGELNVGTSGSAAVAEVKPLSSDSDEDDQTYEVNSIFFYKLELDGFRFTRSLPRA